MANFPSVDTTNISLGQCIIYIGSVGETPATDIGIIDDVTLSISTEYMKVDSEDPNTSKEKYPISNRVTLEGAFYELDYNRFKEIVGSAAGSSLLFEYGGYKTADKYSVRLCHKFPDETELIDSTIEIKLWKVIGSGNLNIDFTRNVHKFPITLELLASTTAWDGSDLTNLGKLFKIYRIDLLYVIDNAGSFVIDDRGRYVTV